MQLCFDAASSAVSMVIAYLLLSDFQLPLSLRPAILTWSIVAALVYPAALYISNGYSTTWQFFGLRDLGSLLLRAIPCFMVLALARAFLGRSGQLSYSLTLLWLGLVVIISSGIRIARRLDHEAVRRAVGGTKRTLLVGTEESLAAAVRQLATYGNAKIIGLLADSGTGTKIAGFRVLGEIVELARVSVEAKVEVVLASTADLESMTDMIETCFNLGIEFRLLPSANDIAGDNVRVIKKVSPLTVRRGAVEETSELHPEVVSCLSGQVVLVTGAGGSIGSELARQIAKISIEKLIVVDQDENSVFELMNEIGKLGPIVPHIADIRDAEAIRDIFQRYVPDVVFHAAAYKHVPLMEQNPCEAVITNVAGTREVAHAAIEVGTKRFVVISTDKAVKPSSIMGASKRLAEMTIQHLAAASSQTANVPRTQFACVRFGNVLGSRGSVLPTFLKQIAAGGPLTVTHAEMTRYFMTIPQAVRLVLQAGTLASNGDIYMLDMGEPVRIMDFARDVVHTCGLVADRDIEIKVVGSRPGEKLHEQLWNEDAEITSTNFPRVFRVHASTVPSNFNLQLESLIGVARERRCDDVRTLLQTMPVDYDVARAHVDTSVLAS